jgi:hypothetical protein
MPTARHPAFDLRPAGMLSALRSKDRSLPGRAATGMRRVVRFLLVALLALAGLARADTIPVKSAELRADADGYVLTAEFDLAFNPTLEEALEKGVALNFVLEFELVRPRWYWLDEKTLTFSTRYRVTYTALTRQFRVASGLLGQAFESLDEVQRFLSRVTVRPAAPGEQFAKGTRYEAAIRLRLDVNALPKPFQVNALAAREWSLQSEWYRWSFTP